MEGCYEKKDLEKIKKYIKTKHYKSCYLHNELITSGTSNLDEINVDYDAFFKLYEKQELNAKILVKDNRKL